MSHNYYVAGYWSGRTEPDAQFAERGAEWFRELGRIDPALRRWYDFDERSRTAVEVLPTVDTLLAKFQRERGWGGGNRFNVWNGMDPPDGVITDFKSLWLAKGFPALCMLSLSGVREGLTRRLLHPETTERLLRELVRIWEPDWAVASTGDILSLYRDATGRIPKCITCGWMTYLRHPRQAIPPLPKPMRVEPVGETGSLVIVTPEPLDASNPAHEDLVLQAQRILGEAELLENPLYSR